MTAYNVSGEGKKEGMWYITGSCIFTPQKKILPFSSLGKRSKFSSHQGIVSRKEEEVQGCRESDTRVQMDIKVFLFSYLFQSLNCRELCEPAVLLDRRHPY